MKKQATLSKQSVSEAAQSKKNAVATKVFATKGVNSGLAKKQTKLTDVPTVAVVPVAKETGDCDAESKASVPACEEIPETSVPVLHVPDNEPSVDPVLLPEVSGSVHQPQICEQQPQLEVLSVPGNEVQHETEKLPATTAPEAVNDRHFRTLLNKYSIGTHVVKRNKIKMGPNTRVVTKEGIMKVVNSIKAHGFIKESSVPLVVFNSPEARFKEVAKIKNNPSLIAEIIDSPDKMYDAGAHRELACAWLEANRHECPASLVIPDEFEVEILVNVVDEYEFYVIGKKHNKITQAQNDDKIVDIIRQTRKMTEKAAALKPKGKKVTQVDAFKQNCAEFKDDDMGTTKFCAYYNFAQHFSPIFLQKLTTATEATGQDIIPFNGLEHLLKFLKDKSLAGRPLYAGQVQLETFNFFYRHWQENGSVLNSKIYGTILLPYISLLLNIKQTAHSLIVEQCDNPVMDKTRPWPLPKELENYFEEHLEGLNLGETGFTYAQDYFTTHIPFVNEVRGYLPAEVKKFFSGGQTQQTAKRSTPDIPQTEVEFCSTKKTKTAAIANTTVEEKAESSTRKSACILINNSKHAHKETSQEEQEHRDSDSDVEMVTVVEGDTQEETESETDGTQSLEFDVDGTSETVLEQQEGWTVPSKEELDLCAAHWISDSLDIEKEDAEFQQYSSKRSEWIQLCENKYTFEQANTDFPNGSCAFIVLDDRNHFTPEMSDELFLSQLSFWCDRLMPRGAIIIIPSITDLSRYVTYLTSAFHVPFKSDGSSFVHYYIYNVSEDNRTKMQVWRCRCVILTL